MTTLESILHKILEDNKIEGEVITYLNSKYVMVLEDLKYIKGEEILDGVLAGIGSYAQKGKVKEALLPFISNTQVPPNTDHDALLALILAGVPGCTLRNNRDSTPQTKLAQNIANFETVGRQTALQQAYAGMVKRKEASTSTSHTSYNHLVATHSSPGGGKSTFLDKVLERAASDLQQCDDPQMAAVLGNSVPLAVTYNAKTPYNLGPIDDVAQYSLWSRVLFCYFFTLSSNLAYFQSFISNNKHLLHVTSVINCIRKDAGGKPVLLALDEVAAAFGRQNVDADRVSGIISEVGKALNAFAWDEFNAVVTTLDTLVVLNEKMRSGRPIEWVTLPCLTTEQATELFDTELQGDNCHLLRFLIIACGGHGRSLELLKFCWGNNKELRSSLNLNQFLPILQGYLNGFNMLSLTTPLVVAALANSRVSLDACLADTKSNKTMREYIRDGYFINNLDGTESAVVPILSPLALLYFAKGDHAASLSQKLAVLLYKMLLVNPGHWQDFEVFHAHWEAVARMVRPTCLMSLSYWYTQVDESDSNPVLINVKPKSNGVVTISQQARQAPNKLLSTNVDYRNGVFLFDSTINNPGFDIILFEDSVAVAFVCRFSTSLSETKLRRDDIIPKYNNAVAILQPHRDFLGTTREILVVVAYRELEQDVHPLPSGIIVLDRDALHKLYSPSLLPILQAMFTEFESREHEPDAAPGVWGGEGSEVGDNSGDEDEGAEEGKRKKKKPSS